MNEITHPFQGRRRDRRRRAGNTAPAMVAGCGCLAATLVLAFATPGCAAGSVYSSFPDLTIAPAINGIPAGDAPFFNNFNSFTLTAPTRFAGAQVVIKSDFGPSAGPDPFTGDGFIGFAVFEDGGGVPGTGLLSIGEDTSSPGFAFSDTGHGTTLVTMPWIDSHVDLQPGDYWFAVGAFLPMQVSGFTGGASRMLTGDFRDGYADTGFSGAFSIEGFTPGIPEPDAWVLAIVGFGMAGASIRWRSAGERRQSWQSHTRP
jgi:hypothetical protein